MIRRMFCRLLISGALLSALLITEAEAHVKGCHTRKCDRRVSEKRHHNYWINRWSVLPGGARYWTQCVSAKESGNRRIARESGFLSYFQWVLVTWHRAGGTGNPETHSWHEQAIKAWRWHVRVPVNQWPNTGEHGLCGS